MLAAESEGAREVVTSDRMTDVRSSEPSLHRGTPHPQGLPKIGARVRQSRRIDYVVLELKQLLGLSVLLARWVTFPRFAMRLRPDEPANVFLLRIG
jgi:hypothetical protein